MGQSDPPAIQIWDVPLLADFGRVVEGDQQPLPVQRAQALHLALDVPHDVVHLSLLVAQLEKQRHNLRNQCSFFHMAQPTNQLHHRSQLTKNRPMHHYINPQTHLTHHVDPLGGQLAPRRRPVGPTALLQVAGIAQQVHVPGDGAGVGDRELRVLGAVRGPGPGRLCVATMALRVIFMGKGSRCFSRPFQHWDDGASVNGWNQSTHFMLRAHFHELLGHIPCRHGALYE